MYESTNLFESRRLDCNYHSKLASIKEVCVYRGGKEDGICERGWVLPKPK